jgi:hypothetical protein
MNDFIPHINVEDFEEESDFVRFVEHNITYRENPVEIICDIRILNLEDISKKYIYLNQELDLLKILISVFDQWSLLKLLDENPDDLTKTVEYYDNFKLLNNTRVWLVTVESCINTCLLYFEQFVIGDLVQFNNKTDCKDIYS